MLTRRFDPFYTLEQFQWEAGQLLDRLNLLSDRGVRYDHALFPALNVWEDNDNLYVEAEIPGIKQEDLEVYAVGNEFTLKGKRPPIGDEKLTYHRQERGTGDFTRMITLPVEVNADKIEAHLKNGVLSVTLPKAEEVKPKKITINS